MIFDQLRAVIRATTEVEWCGQKVLIRKLAAADHLALFGRIKEATDDTREATIAFHVELAARSLADEQGNLACDSDDGRLLLRETPFTDLIDLGNIILRHNGYADEKKSSAETNALPSSCAESLDATTPTTSQ